MPCFSLDTYPFNFLVKTSAWQLKTELVSLYPHTLLNSVALPQIYDFVIDYRRRFAGRSWPYHFRCSGEHFRMADKAQRVATFEWGLNWCVAAWQQQYLAIHAAVLEKQGQALILPAPPGSGKSTLCALLMLQGWRLLSDEMCLLDADSGEVVPFVRPVSLKNNSISVIKQFYPDQRLHHFTPDTEKGLVAYLSPTKSSWQRFTETATPRWVLFPQYSATNRNQIFALPQAASLMHLAQNSFNYSAWGEQGFTMLSKLVQHTESLRFEYSDTPQALATLEQLLS